MDLNLIYGREVDINENFGSFKNNPGDNISDSHLTREIKVNFKEGNILKDIRHNLVVQYQINDFKYSSNAGYLVCKIHFTVYSNSNGWSQDFTEKRCIIY